jgi:hypothetical protein
VRNMMLATALSTMANCHACAFCALNFREWIVETKQGSTWQKKVFKR